MRISLLVVVILVLGCKTQYSVTTNEVITTKDHLYGVKSKEGKLLIDSIYSRIHIFNEHAKLTLPPKKPISKQLEYYVVSNSNNKKALFNQDGKLVFGFIDCLSIIFDQHTQMIVATKKEQANTQPRSYLYNIKGELLFDASFENIAFINNADLIALIVEDGANDEFYLWNPFTMKKLGPFDHFNIYNDDSRLPKGMEDSVFETCKRLNIIAVRTEVDNDYIWGIIDSKGNEILPIEYKNLKIFLESKKNHPAFKKAIKPEGVEFIFTGAHMSKPSTSIYLDSSFVKYEFKTISRKDGEYLIEKM